MGINSNLGLRSENDGEIEMNQNYDDTIYAVSTAPGRGAVAIIRISGNGAQKTAELFGLALPKARRAGLRYLRVGGRTLDRALVLFFSGPESFTGEDIIELHIHGGKAVQEGVLEVLNSLEGFRPAEPGEFSRRAVVNNRMDLTAAEGINDLINAQTEAQRAQAFRQAEGGLGRRFDIWTAEILGVCAHIEAYIDFPDELIPSPIKNDLIKRMEDTLSEMMTYAADGRRGELLREGLRVAIVGPPNAGKSSFINWLTDKNTAIVSDRPGTTRDVIEAHLNIGGYPVIVADTAGIRKETDELEAEGIRRAKEWSKNAELRIVILDATKDDILLKEFKMDKDDLVIVNKVDCVKEPKGEPSWFYTAITKGHGLQKVAESLEVITRRKMDVRAAPLMTLQRHRKALKISLTSLRRAIRGLQTESNVELVAEDLRTTSASLGQVTGRSDVEDLLDIIFKEFCIGK